MPFFHRLDSIGTYFIRTGTTTRTAKTTLQLPITVGSLALPRFIKFYWAAVLVTVLWWFSEAPAKPLATLEAALLDSCSELRTWPA